MYAPSTVPETGMVAVTGLLPFGVGQVAAEAVEASELKPSRPAVSARAAPPPASARPRVLLFLCW
ncbi:hypothetical protein GCM10010346_20870 [Streptomyces chryseus]|uniref:Uncharacterized protein n=1 Tax=Streptomyces chryseus TaxID=68186 RepID=A0ABQ3DJE3_9ACTN|nr:hypothetical protein GCM10010346_20870 [Streptomyces chryseus]